MERRGVSRRLAAFDKGARADGERSPWPSSTSPTCPPRCRRGAPLVGLDLGEKTIGVAVSDIGRMIASPLALIRKTKFTSDAEALFALMDERAARPAS